MATEVEFADKLLHLLQVTDPGADAKQAFADAFKVESITKIPATFNFPPLAHPVVPGAHSGNAKVISDGSAAIEDEGSDGMECAVEFNFKSLKQPKFNISVVFDVKGNTTVFQIKSLLSKVLKEEQNVKIDADPSDIKLMVRAKSLSDSDNVFSVLDNAGSREKIALNVIIAKYKDVTESTLIDVSKPDNNGNSQSIRAETWLKIEQLIHADVTDESVAAEIISKLKNALV